MTRQYDEFVFVAATYDDVSVAEDDYNAVKDLYYDLGVADSFDAAVISKVNGRVKIVRKHEQPTRHGGWLGAGWGLAAGLGLALFPAIGIGVAGWTAATGAGLGAIAGHVTGGMSRSDLKELGEHLDSGHAALVVAAASDVEARVEQALGHAIKVLKKQGGVDADALAKELEDTKSAVEAG